MATDDDRDEVGMKDLEGHSENLAAVATNKKSVTEQLVDNNAKLTATNKEVVAIVKTFQRK